MGTYGKVIPFTALSDLVVDERVEANPLEAILAREEQQMSDIQVAQAKRLLRALPVLERRVLAWRFPDEGAPLTQRAIAERLGMAERTIRNVEKRALQMLRDEWQEPLKPAA